MLIEEHEILNYLKDCESELRHIIRTFTTPSLSMMNRYSLMDYMIYIQQSIHLAECMSKLCNNPNRFNEITATVHNLFSYVVCLMEDDSDISLDKNTSNRILDSKEYTGGSAFIHSVITNVN